MLKRPIKVYFLTTMSAGVGYYRQWMFKEAMNRQGLADAIMPWFHSEQDRVVPWQFHVKDDPQVYATRGGVINEMCRVADVVVVQYVHSREALALVEALKYRYSRMGEGRRILDHFMHHMDADPEKIINSLHSGPDEAEWIRAVAKDPDPENLADYPEKVFLTEIDDYIFDTPTDHVAFEQYQPGYLFREVITEQMKALDGIIVTTPFLRDAYARFNPNIHVVPNCLDFDVWDKVENAHTKDVRIGWVGGATHAEDLRTIEKPLKEFLKKNTNCFFYCVHGIPDFFKGQTRIVPIQKWFRIDKYPKKLAKYAFDIGLAPLVDNNFNRGKSNLRKLEYAGLKIPVLAANVGHFAQTVRHGKDGFLYNTPEEFYRCLELLAFDKKLRSTMGRLNYFDVKQNYNADIVAREYVRILKKCHARGQTVPVDMSSEAERTGESKWTEGQPGLLSA